MARHVHHLPFVFGLLGSVMSFLVYLAPLPTFYKIFKRKSTEGFQSIPYSIALFSAMLMLYYASLKVDAFILITINFIGCVIESMYLIIHIIYAPKNTRIYTAKLFVLFNLGAYGLILLVTSLFSHGSLRMNIVGWICAVFSVCVFAAPLSIIKLVIKTKSVEYMPFSLSLFLTLCAICWLLYGLSKEDYYIATPNFLGLVFGFIQMILYFVYKNRKNGILPKTQSEELAYATQMSKDETEENCNANLNHLKETAMNEGAVDNNKPMGSSELNV